MNRIAKFVFQQRNILAALPLVCAFFSVRWEHEVDWILWPLAASLCFAGALVRAWARWHNAYAQGRKKTLAMTGPYALVRNPLYIGTLLVIAGAGVASELDWLLFAAVGWAFCVFAVACKHEERRLLAKYGPAYEAYRVEVPAWWPRAVPDAPARIRESGFGMILAVQVFYASLWLAPFIVKDLNPLSI